MIVWMVFGGKLLSYFSISAIYFFLKHLCYRHRRAAVTLKLSFRSPRRDPFIHPL